MREAFSLLQVSVGARTRPPLVTPNEPKSQIVPVCVHRAFTVLRQLRTELSDVLTSHIAARRRARARHARCIHVRTIHIILKTQDTPAMSKELPHAPAKHHGKCILDPALVTCLPVRTQ